MAQYQSFPDADGDSRTLEKLKALKLPELAGRSFLDVGCNEGFFCGFAKFVGARRSVGIDRSKLFIERARQRFPDCEFHQRDWETLPEGPFDVILLASALHYADDQPRLVRRLVEHLSADGVLVLELGIVSSRESEWVEVERGIDRRTFPTMAKLREVLDGLAWKWMGTSVSQDGDPVARHVMHVSRRRPVAYLLMQPPAYGKTTIAGGLFPGAGIPIVSGDQKIAEIAQGRLKAPSKLAGAVSRGYSPFRIDEAVRRVFDAGAGIDLVRLWSDEAAGRDFALDAYVPSEQHAAVEQHLIGLGYLPVHLQWNRVGALLPGALVVEERADAFFQSMGLSTTPRPMTEGRGVVGFVDRLMLENGCLVIRGWAVDASGNPPECIGVRLDGRTLEVETFERQQRPDVQKHLGHGHAALGFRAIVRDHGLARLDEAGDGLEIFVHGVGRIPMSKDVAKALRKAR